MALIDCPECCNQISESARGCPHCGFMLTGEVITAQKEAKATREQEATEMARREERKMVIWMGAIAAAFVAIVILCAITPSTNTYEPRWSDGISDTASAKKAPWLRGFSDKEKETILQESYLFDAAAKQLERERDR